MFFAAKLSFAHKSCNFAAMAVINDRCVNGHHLAIAA
jgi:hypothetical protein